jgi:uncharacterized phage protein (TIGR02218 family)
MLDISSSFQQKLDRQATTLCHCWRLLRRDGVIMGFTDHDRDLTFDGVVFRASTGLSATEAERSLGLSVATSEAAGALSDDSLSESDLLNGLYDNASVETWLVDWSDPQLRTLLDVATIGEVRRGEGAFSAELRSSAHFFDQTQGRAFQRGCAADFGDGRCKLSIGAFASTGVVAAFSGGVLTLNLSGVFESGFFTGGRLTFTGGVNGGAKVTIKSHRRESGLRATITLWTPPGAAIVSGDVVSLTAGCDKSATTCRTKFGNIVNFRGFPHMPGNDLVIAYPSSRSQAMDGGSFFQ